MPLLTQELREVLPRIGQQADAGEYLIYAHFSDTETDSHWYVAEGQDQKNDFCFFGFISAPGQAEWTTFLLSELEKTGGVELDAEFAPGLFTDVIPAPED